MSDGHYVGNVESLVDLCTTVLGRVSSVYSEHQLDGFSQAK